MTFAIMMKAFVLMRMMMAVMMIIMVIMMIIKMAIMVMMMMMMIVVVVEGMHLSLASLRLPYALLQAYDYNRITYH